jgi:hypothetical protein
MDAIEQLHQDVREGRIGVDGLIGVIVTQQRQLDTLQRELQSAHQRIAELEKNAGGTATAKVDEPFSMPPHQNLWANSGSGRSPRR